MFEFPPFGMIICAGPAKRRMAALHIRSKTLAGYWQRMPVADHRLAGRAKHRLGARDRFDATAPFAFGAQNLPLDSDETQYALHVGAEHRFNNVVSVFGRAARAFRTPNVDERVSSGPSFDAFFNPIPGNFSLKTQTSHDIEGGFRIKSGGFQLQSSIYNMDLDRSISSPAVLTTSTPTRPAVARLARPAPPRCVFANAKA
jgi:iron complex outermembrane receptor protein